MTADAFPAGQEISAVSEIDNDNTSRYREILVLSIVPVAVAMLILVSWALAYWGIGPTIVNASLATRGRA